VIEPKVVNAIRDMASNGCAIKEIARKLAVGRNAVRHYLRRPVPAGFQVRPRARRLADEWHEQARNLFSVERNATAVHRLLVARGLQISVWVVRRAVADLRPGGARDARAPPGRGPPPPSVSGSISTRFDWEFRLLRAIAKKFGGYDPTELEAALTEHLAKLQPRQSEVRDWKAFLRTALRRRALNWIRDRRRQQQRETSLDRPRSSDDERMLQDRLSAPGQSLADSPIVEQIRHGLDPKLRRIFDAWIRERLNQTQTAAALGVHPNTIRNALRRIAQSLEGHEF
jgi:RNA polymerase sigma factor (sigma-70 family)